MAQGDFGWQVQGGPGTDVSVVQSEYGPRLKIVNGFAAITQIINAEKYRGKRLRFSGNIESESVEEEAFLLLSVNAGGPDYSVSSGSMKNRRISGTSNRQNHSIILDVAENALGIFMSFRLDGKGIAWIDGIHLEIVSTDTLKNSPESEKEEGWKPKTEEEKQSLIDAYQSQPSHPVNLDFEIPLPAKTDYTFKKVNGLEIKARVLTIPGDGEKPVVVWIHGGALIGGSRHNIPDRLARLVHDGIIVVSLDYRLAPESKLPLIIEDIEDAFKWIRARGPELFNANPNRIAVWGGSAGGYLTLIAGFRVEPPPQVLVSLYGYGDLIGDWQSQPSRNARHNPKGEVITETEAMAQVTGPPISESQQRKGDIWIFYRYCRQNGILSKLSSGWDPHTQAENFYPYMPVKNVTSDYPPTFLMHGDQDTDVPHEQSVLMSEQFEKHGVPYKFITLENGEHGFSGADPKAIKDANDAAIEFTKEKLMMQNKE